MGSMSVSPCSCCMYTACVHPLANINAAFCMTCSLLCWLVMQEATKLKRIRTTQHTRGGAVITAW